jgi:hypothetical protein
LEDEEDDEFEDDEFQNDSFLVDDNELEEEGSYQRPRVNDD